MKTRGLNTSKTECVGRRYPNTAWYPRGLRLRTNDTDNYIINYCQRAPLSTASQTLQQLTPHFIHSWNFKAIHSPKLICEFIKIFTILYLRWKKASGAQSCEIFKWQFQYQQRFRADRVPPHPNTSQRLSSQTENSLLHEYFKEPISVLSGPTVNWLDSQHCDYTESNNWNRCVLDYKNTICCPVCEHSKVCKLTVQWATKTFTSMHCMIYNHKHHLFHPRNVHTGKMLR